MKVYIAGASKEIERAERWARRLTEADIQVTSTWMANIRKVGQANPADATIEQYKQWAINQCLGEVNHSDVLWLLLPEAETIGAYVELGFGFARDKLIVASGKHRPIFTPALAKCHSLYDAEIAAYLTRLSMAPDNVLLPFKIDGEARDWSAPDA